MLLTPSIVALHPRLKVVYRSPASFKKKDPERNTMNASSEPLVLLYSRDQIAQRVKELAATISSDYAGSDLVLIGILRGAFIFVADIIRQLTIPVKIDFIGASSYGLGTETSGQVAITKELQVPVSGRDLLLMEDILDTGVTLQAIQAKLKELGARSVKICTLIDKRERRVVEVTVDYVGFETSGFIVGYGIDYAERYRNLPDIYRIDGLPETGS
jgi:hypoxanthine phosphoribosyltransferase